MNEFFSLLTEACGEWDTGQVMFDVGQRMEQYRSRAPVGPNEMAGLGEKMMNKKKIFLKWEYGQYRKASGICRITMRTMVNLATY